MRKKFSSMAAAILLMTGCSLQIAAIAPVAAQTSAATASENQAAIEGVLAAYETALNASDVDAVMSLYTGDAVLLYQDTPTIVGSEAVRLFYTGTFQAIAINLKFEIAEVLLASDEWAFLRSTSSGTVKILATGDEAPGQTQELFVLHKEAGQWKLARYSFSSTLPAAM